MRISRGQYEQPNPTNLITEPLPLPQPVGDAH